MIIPQNIKKYDRVEFTGLSDDKELLITCPDGMVLEVNPFLYQPTRFEYDHHGYESIVEDGKPEFRARFTPEIPGKYSVNGENFYVADSENPGFIRVSEKDSRYFIYENGESFFPIGINMAFPTSYQLSNGVEFGLSDKMAYLGLRQYRRWLDKCAENGVNLIRLWIGHPYFTVDTEETYKLNYKKFNILDEIVEMARERNIKLKLTLEQFRYFDYDGSKKTHFAFLKKMYHEGEPCIDRNEWLVDEKWQNAWLYKVGELAKRYNGDTTIFTVELWNEMDCFGDVSELCKKMLPKLRKVFPSHLITNSYGSFDCDLMLQRYKNFCWEETDFIQIHRYLDQGAAYEICNHPIEMMKDALTIFTPSEKPVLIAETGAVNDSHSSEFRYYASDDRGIIFADTVYTSAFCGGCGIGNIWHWDERYVEAKKLYKMFKPVSEVFDGIDFQSEDFTYTDLSNDSVHMLSLSGKNTHLLYIRNKADTWQNVLRDLIEPETVDSITLPNNLKGAKIIPIWDEETATLQGSTLSNLKYGVFIRGIITTSKLVV